MNINNYNNQWNMQNQKSYLNHTARGLVGFKTRSKRRSHSNPLPVAPPPSPYESLGGPWGSLGVPGGSLGGPWDFPSRGARAAQAQKPTKSRLRNGGMAPGMYYE